MRQLKNMFKPVRLIASLIFIGALALTLFAAFKLKFAPLVLICVIIQFAALIWYIFSYIPFGRTCLKTLVTKVATSV